MKLQVITTNANLAVTAEPDKPPIAIQKLPRWDGEWHIRQTPIGEPASADWTINRGKGDRVGLDIPLLPYRIRSPEPEVLIRFGMELAVALSATPPRPRPRELRIVISNLFVDPEDPAKLLAYVGAAFNYP